MKILKNIVCWVMPALSACIALSMLLGFGAVYVPFLAGLPSVLTSFWRYELYLCVPCLLICLLGAMLFRRLGDEFRSHVLAYTFCSHMLLGVLAFAMTVTL